MVLPAADFYACNSGGVISAGRTAVSPDTAVVGDSISTELYGLSSAYWATALSGGRARIVAQCGVGSTGISNWVNGIDNSYLNAFPGLAGLTNLGRVFFRLGTNDCWADHSYASLQSSYETLFSKLAGYASEVYILSVPPMGGASYAAYNYRTIEYNAAYAAYCAAHPGQFTFVDDTAVMRNVDGSQKAEYFHADRLHLGGGGMYYAGLALASVLNSRLNSLPSPVERFVSDIYPAGNEWHANPLNAGTAGTFTGGSGASGQISNGWNVSTDFSGTTVACSKVAADVGDSNQTPWQRFNLTAVHANGTIQADATPVGRDLTTTDPLDLEGVVEFRLNNLDLTKLQYIEFLMSANTGDLLLRRMRLNMGIATSVNHTGVLRHRVRRSGSNDPASAVLTLFILGAAAGSNIGSIDFRNFTVRG